jgi:hypothetical protein
MRDEHDPDDAYNGNDRPRRIGFDRMLARVVGLFTKMNGVS